MWGYEGTNTLRHIWRVYISAPLLGMVIWKVLLWDTPKHEQLTESSFKTKTVPPMPSITFASVTISGQSQKIKPQNLDEGMTEVKRQNHTRPQDSGFPSVECPRGGGPQTQKPTNSPWGETGKSDLRAPAQTYEIWISGSEWDPGSCIFQTT